MPADDLEDTATELPPLGLRITKLFCVPIHPPPARSVAFALLAIVRPIGMARDVALG